MKRLILLRHAKSDWSDSNLPDHDRPLNNRGRDNAVQLGKYFKYNNIKIDHVFCSTAARARETLTYLQNTSGLFYHTSHKNRLYGARPEAILSLLQAQEDPVLNTIMIVGHNPCIEETTIHLTKTDESNLLPLIQQKVPTGTHITLDFQIESFAHISLKSGILRNFIRPKHELLASLHAPSENS